MAASATEQRPSEINTASYSVRVPRKLKARIKVIDKHPGMKRGWHSELVTEFVTKIVEIHEKKLGIKPPT